MHSLLAATWSVVELATLRSHLIRRANVSLDEGQDLLDELDGIGSLQERGVNGSSSLSLHVEEVSSVLGVGLQLLADLGELVVSHEQLLAIDLEVVELRASSGGNVGLLVADEGSGGILALIGGENSDGLDLTVRSENVSQVLLIVIGGEALNEEVALLLGVLKALLLTEDLSLTLSSGKSWLNVELEAIKLFVVKLIDSSLSALGAIAFVGGVVVADKSEGLLVVVLVNLLHHSD